MIPDAQEWTTGGLVLRLDADGWMDARLAGPPTPLLAQAGGLAVATAGGDLDLGAPEIGADADEVELTWEAAGLRAVLRHSFEPGWTVRVVLVSTSDVELRLTRVHLAWRAASGTAVCALAAGATAAYVVQPADGTGPLLVGRLRSGSQPGVDDAGLELGPLVLPPGHRWAAQWRFEVVGAARLADPAGTLPRTPWLDLDQVVALPAGPDVAVVADGLEVEQGEDGVRVAAYEPRSAAVELRGARGTTTYALSWAPDLDDLVEVEVEALLSGPTTPQIGQ